MTFLGFKHTEESKIKIGNAHLGNKYRVGKTAWNKGFSDGFTPQQRNKKRYYQRVDLVNKLKDVPCKDCGIKYAPYVMDFDHVRGKKLFELNRSKLVPLQKLFDEIAKCDVLCANCHRTRTHGRK